LGKKLYIYDTSTIIPNGGYMSEPIKLTDEEFSPVGALRDQMVMAISTIGQLKITYDLIQEDLATTDAKLKDGIKSYKALVDNEKKLISGLYEKYGVGSLDIETGIFTPAK
jgi:hypothetical protein